MNSQGAAREIFTGSASHTRISGPAITWSAACGTVEIRVVGGGTFMIAERGSKSD